MFREWIFWTTRGVNDNKTADGYVYVCLLESSSTSIAFFLLHTYITYCCVMDSCYENDANSVRSSAYIHILQYRLLFSTYGGVTAPVSQSDRQTQRLFPSRVDNNRLRLFSLFPDGGVNALSVTQGSGAVINRRCSAETD